MRLSKMIFIFLLFQSFFCFAVKAQQKQFKLLLVTTTRGWHHESLHAGVLAIQDLGKRNFFDVVLFEDPNGFTDKFLAQFQVVLFLNKKGDIFY
jgi:hypothetical protein